MERTIRIAIVQALNGSVSVCGPDEGVDYPSPMDAALCWMIERGDAPANRYWVTVNLPSPSLTEIDLDAEAVAHDTAPLPPPPTETR